MFVKHKFDEKNKIVKAGEENLQDDDQPVLKSKPVIIDGEYIPETIPLIITAWKGYEQYFQEHNFTSLFKRNFFVEYGVRLPEVLMNYEEKRPARHSDGSH